jgi:hypothetical protein
MVKVEILKNEDAQRIAFAFESSNIEDLEILDLLRVMIMGDHEKRAGYVNSKRLVVEVNTGVIEELGS